MTAAQAFTELDAWQVMAWGLAFFGSLYLAGGWGMTALTRWLQRRGTGRVLDTRPLKPDQLRREWRQSLHSVLIFGIGMIVPWGFLQLGWARLEPYAGPWRIAAEIVVLLIWNDVHFWINHRLLHTRLLGRFHGDHHRSIVTTPWSTYSFASRRHHLHHARPNGNYGFALAFMDRLMRTRVALPATARPRTE
jgi:sterol desaturase/sphingolipid hydroxylase (fatty acid hydroxylase superfamily)